MGRSLKKGPFVQPKLLKRIEQMNKTGEKRVSPQSAVPWLAMGESGNAPMSPASTSRSASGAGTGMKPGSTSRCRSLINCSFKRERSSVCYANSRITSFTNRSWDSSEDARNMK